MLGLESLDMAKHPVSLDESYTGSLPAQTISIASPRSLSQHFMLLELPLQHIGLILIKPFVVNHAPEPMHFSLVHTPAASTIDPTFTLRSMDPAASVRRHMQATSSKQSSVPKAHLISQAVTSTHWHGPFHVPADSGNKAQAPY